MADTQTEKPLSADQLMARACWIVGLLYQTSSHLRIDGGEALGQINMLMRRSKPRAGGPAVRLADALWLLETRLKWPRKEHELAEEEAVVHLANAHAEPTKSGNYRVWQAIDLQLNLRKRLIGPLPLLSPNPASLQESEPFRLHQQVVFRIDKRFHQLEGAKVRPKAWLKGSLDATLKIDPNPMMLGAMERFSKLVWAAFAPQRRTKPELKRMWIEAQSDFWHHYRSNPQLAHTPIGDLARRMDQIPNL